MEDESTKTQGEPFEEVERIEKYVASLSPKCWVCQNNEWDIVKDDKNFGIVPPAFTVATSMGAQYGLPLTVMICTKCATVWMVSTYAALNVIGDEGVIKEDSDVAG